MLLEFTKMNGLGNDYIFVDAFKNPEWVDKIRPYIPKLSDRHFGAGGDGVIFVAPSEKADCRMRMFNADGSEGPMCGNGIRELAKLVWDKEIIKNNPLMVETESGVKKVTLKLDRDGKVESAKVDMGALSLDTDDFFNSPDGGQFDTIPVFNYPFEGKEYIFYVGAVGAWHAVCFLKENVEEFDFCALGMQIEKDKSLFPSGVNVEFVNAVTKNKCIMRVWERGSGHTLACGTGASFVAAVGRRLGYFGDDVEVVLERGSLYITLDGDDIIMEGSVDHVYEGITDLDKLK